MKPEKLFEIIGEVDEKFITEAAEYPQKTRGTGLFLRLAAAACFALVLGVSAWFVWDSNNGMGHAPAGDSDEHDAMWIIAEFLQNFPSIYSFGVLTTEGNFRDFNGRLLRETPIVQWADTEFLIDGENIDSLSVDRENYSVATGFFLYDIGDVPLVQIRFTPFVQALHVGEFRYTESESPVPSLGVQSIWSHQTTPYMPEDFGPSEWQYFQYVNGEFVRVEIPEEGFIWQPGGGEPRTWVGTPEFFRDSDNRLIYTIWGQYWHVNLHDGELEPLEELERPVGLFSLRSELFPLRTDEMRAMERALDNLFFEQRFSPEQGQSEVEQRIWERHFGPGFNIEATQAILNFLENFPTIFSFGILQDDGTFIDLNGNVLDEPPTIQGRFDTSLRDGMPDDFTLSRYNFVLSSDVVPNTHAHTTADNRIAVATNFQLFDIGETPIVQIEFSPVEGGRREWVQFHYVNGGFIPLEFVTGFNMPPPEHFTTEATDSMHFPPAFVLGDDGRLLYGITWATPDIWHVELHPGVLEFVESLPQMVRPPWTLLQMHELENFITQYLSWQFSPARARGAVRARDYHTGDVRIMEPDELQLREVRAEAEEAARRHEAAARHRHRHLRAVMQERHENATAGAIVVSGNTLYLDPVYRIDWITDDRIDQVTAVRTRAWHNEQLEMNGVIMLSIASIDLWQPVHNHEPETLQFHITNNTRFIITENVLGEGISHMYGSQIFFEPIRNDFFHSTYSATVFYENYIGTSTESRGIFFVETDGDRVTSVTFEIRHFQ